MQSTFESDPRDMLWTEKFQFAPYSVWGPFIFVFLFVYVLKSQVYGRDSDGFEAVILGKRQVMLVKLH